MKARWLRATGDDGQQHVLYLPERCKHKMRASCPCGPYVDGGAFVHQVLTGASWPRGRRERDH